MDFGKISNFYEVDLSLPGDHSQTMTVLNSIGDLKRDHQLEVFIGAPMWSHKNFVGKVYPEKTQPTDYLKHYSQNFGSIELNTTHYQIPSKLRVDQWLEKSSLNPGFKFCPKFPQSISHFNGDFSTQTKLIESFLLSLSYFQQSLGLSFIQMPQYFDITRASFLKNFLSRFPEHIELAIEFRHPSWFERNKVTDSIFTFLSEKNISTVISDVAGRRDVCHMRLTTKKVFIRFTGNSLHSSDFQRLDDWIKRLETWEKLGLEQVYFFMHQPDESQCVELAQYFQKKSTFSFLAPQTIKKIQQLDLLDM